MSSGLVRRTSGSGLSTPGAGASLGPGEQSTAGVDFSGGAYFWDDLPAGVADAATRLDGPVAAEEIDPGDQRVRHRDGAYWQNQTAWRATRAGITILRLRKPLRRLDGKKFTPAGPVMVHQVEEYPAAKPPTRRQASMPTTPTRSAAATGQGGGADRTDDRGLEMLGYLPSQVQTETLRAISNVTYSHGNLWQHYTAERLPIKHEISLIRLGGGKAVVITAVKEADMLPAGATAEQAQARVVAAPWAITRYLYELRTTTGTSADQAVGSGGPGSGRQLGG